MGSKGSDLDKVKSAKFSVNKKVKQHNAKKEKLTQVYNPRQRLRPGVFPIYDRFYLS